MSYDLYLYPPEEQAPEHASVYRQLSFSSLDPLWPEMPDPISIMKQDRIVAELCEIYPEFTIFTSHYDYTELGEGKGRRVELTQESGLQVALYQDSAFITIPYGYRDESSLRAIFEQIRKCVAAIEDVTGYVTEDPQSKGLVKLPDDIEYMVRAYLGMMGRIDKDFIQNSDS